MKINYDKYLKKLEALPWPEEDKRKAIQELFGITQAVYDQLVKEMNRDEPDKKAIWNCE